MNERKTETITIGGNVQYAKVSSRSAEFHRDNEQCAIATTVEFKDGFALFCATVTTKKGTFTGHSLGKVGATQKQFEKQETIAVGRALAFAGYLATGDIACAEEMEDFVTTAQLNGLKLKYAKVNAAELEGLERPEQQEKFNRWCFELVGEDVNYLESSDWTRQWLDDCWSALKRLANDGVDPDVPFEA